MARRGYPAEFRRRAIGLVEGGRKISEVSMELGVSQQTIYVWRKRFGKLEAVDVKRLRQLSWGTHASRRFCDRRLVLRKQRLDLAEHRHSWSVEVGYETEIDGLGEGNYRASWFRTDSKGRGRSNKSVDGVSLTFDQDFGDNFAAFGYFSRRSGGVGSMEQNLSAGLMLNQPFGFDHDLLGFAFTWGKPDGGNNLDDQYGLEAFYRIQLIDRVEVTPLLQYIIDPTNSNTDSRFGGGLRLRIYL